MARHKKFSRSSTGARAIRENRAMGFIIPKEHSFAIENTRLQWEPLFTKAVSISDSKHLVPVIRALKKISKESRYPGIFHVLLLRLGMRIGQDMVADAFNLYADTLRLEKLRKAKRTKN